jgi:uncharacterized protein
MTVSSRYKDLHLVTRSSSKAVSFGPESTFSPNGRTLFVNIQASAGMSFAIFGPWREIGV